MGDGSDSATQRVTIHNNWIHDGGHNYMPGVGVWLDVTVGDAVTEGQELIRVVHRDGRALDAALALLDQAVVIGDGPADALPLIVDEIA